LNISKRKNPDSPSWIKIDSPPDAREICWENMGYGSSDKIKELLIAYVISFVSSIIAGILLTILPDRVSGLYVLIGTIVIMVSFIVLLQYLSVKKKSKTLTS
jgi:hypothetical protein